MDFDINFPPLEENNNEELNLSIFTSSQPHHPQQQQPNIPLEDQPQPKPYKPSPFEFQYIRPETPNPSFSQLVQHDFLELLQPQPCTLQEVPENPIMVVLHQQDDMHVQELPFPFDLSSQEPNPNVQDQERGHSRLHSPRKKLVRARKQVKSDTITLPYPWATSTRATVQSLEYLLSNNIVSIPGVVKCKGCSEQYEIQFDLKEKFNEVAMFIIEEKNNMHDRAPESWEKPVLPTCNHCRKENSLAPVLKNTKKRTINWLFLLLGQMIGCCSLDYLKYFCKHTKNHRTGAKDRLIYLTYLGLCKQLCPHGPFDP